MLSDNILKIYRIQILPKTANTCIEESTIRGSANVVLPTTVINAVHDNRWSSLCLFPISL